MAFPGFLAVRDMTDSSVRASVWMLCGAMAFALMGTLAHALGPRCDWLVIALVRSLFSFCSVAVLARAARVRLVFWKPRTLWTRSIAGSLSLVGCFFALTRLPVSDVLTITNTYPLWILVLSWWQERHPPSVGDLLGVASGVAGVVLIQRPHLGHSDSLATLAALVSSFAAAVAMLGLHRLRQLDARAIVAHFSGVASLATGGWLMVRGIAGRSGAIEPVTILMLSGVGIMGTVGQLFLTRAYAAGAPTRVAVLGLTQVVFAMVLDVLIGGRLPAPVTLAGSALVLAPTAWIMSRAGAHARAPEAG